MAVKQAAPGAIEEGARLLREGALVAFPTETVYGLGADATNGLAVARIFEAKGRPRFNPLIVHVLDLAAAELLGRFDARAQKLASIFWPGPLTLVVPRRADSGLSELATAELDTVAIRAPGHPVARALLAAASRPIAAPSANRSGHVSATEARHVAEDLGGAVDLVIDGGTCPHGVESTVVDASGTSLAILRHGAVTREEIERIAGVALDAAMTRTERPLSPGQLESHYAPGIPVRLGARHVRSSEALLAFGPDMPPHSGPAINLSPSGDLREAAANLFAALRTLDRTGARAIAVMPVPEHGLGAAINDRLRRAAAPR